MRIHKYLIGLCAMLLCATQAQAVLQQQLGELSNALNQLAASLGVVTPPPPPPSTNGFTPPPPPPSSTNGTTTKIDQTGKGLLAEIGEVELKKVEEEKKKPEVVTGLDLSQEELQKRAKARREREASRKRKREAGPITQRFIKGTLKRYPQRATQPVGLKSADFKVEKIVIKSVGLLGDKYLNDLEANLFTYEDKKDKQELAKKTLNGLLFFVRNIKIQPANIKKIYDLVVYILNIDPLLINTAAAVLRDVGFGNFAVHRLMVLFFNERIAFINEQLQQLKVKATEGVIQDIDEAFAYSIALSSELQRQESVLLQEQSTEQQKKAAQLFVETIKKLRTKLCDIITAPDTIKLFNSKPALQQLYRMICGKQKKTDVRVYCVTAPHTYGPLLTGKAHTYCGFNEEVDDLIKLIDDYKQAAQKGVVPTSQRVHTVQSIISSLEDMNLFFQNPDFCPNCLRRAIKAEYPEIRETAEVPEPFKKKLAQIAAFLQEINQKQQSFYLENFVRTGIPKIKATLDRVRKLTDFESGMIYDLIGINRKRREEGKEPLSLKEYLEDPFSR